MFEVAAETSARYTATLVDETETGIDAAALSTLTLTLRDAATGDVINHRDEQDVLNANGVTIDSAGNLVWTMDPEDTVIVTASRRREHHVAQFVATWGVDKRLVHDVDLFVVAPWAPPAED